MSDLRYELHIRPLFRAMDREHMKSRFDLWNYDDVVRRADDLLRRLAVDMPTPASGGPWPQEWIALFRRWKDEGFKRLELGTAALTRAQAGSKIIISATGTFPAAGYRGWLELEGESPTSRTYAMYFDPPDQAQAGAPQPFTMLERYPSTDTRQVFVRDSTGVRELPLTPGPAPAGLANLSDLEFFGRRSP